MIRKKGDVHSPLIRNFKQITKKLLSLEMSKNNQTIPSFAGVCNEYY